MAQSGAIWGNKKSAERGAFSRGARRGKRGHGQGQARHYGWVAGFLVPSVPVKGTNAANDTGSALEVASTSVMCLQPITKKKAPQVRNAGGAIGSIVAVSGRQDELTTNALPSRVQCLPLTGVRVGPRQVLHLACQGAPAARLLAGRPDDGPRLRIDAPPKGISWQGTRLPRRDVGTKSHSVKSRSLKERSRASKTRKISPPVSRMLIDLQLAAVDS